MKLWYVLVALGIAIIAFLVRKFFTTSSVARFNVKGTSYVAYRKGNYVRLYRNNDMPVPFTDIIDQMIIQPDITRDNLISFVNGLTEDLNGMYNYGEDVVLRNLQYQLVRTSDTKNVVIPKIVPFLIADERNMFSPKGHNDDYYARVLLHFTEVKKGESQVLNTMTLVGLESKRLTWENIIRKSQYESLISREFDLLCAYGAAKGKFVPSIFLIQVNDDVANIVPAFPSPPSPQFYSPVDVSSCWIIWECTRNFIQSGTINNGILGGINVTERKGFYYSITGEQIIVRVPQDSQTGH